MIPRKIHYCWFGGKPLPLQARRCLASWSYLLPDYEVVRWDEHSFDPSSHPFTAAAYQAGRYAFVSDYVRMLALQQGGIYMDVDVEVCGRFDALLGLELFIGLEDCQRFSTSVIGVQAGHWLPRSMLSYYDGAVFDCSRLSALVNVNEVSRLLLACGFSGEGGSEQLGLERTLAIGVFADAQNQSLSGVQPIARHLYAGSWRVREKKSKLSNAWYRLRKLPEQLSAVFYLCAFRLAILVRRLTG
ncbi:glycosyltransferase [Pseudomonas sp. SA3-5]|uniref:Glycosyltransferase n=1 Tax=Pseudomonas aestuarii TaxID=3018340 RepID=A0ABT4X9V8_9PSED|nr:glycosyltransferase [Pseudomonas aestuarii]MDA7084923.1 glycosyltransferase [Pseudomonas aestuarii]